MSTLTPQTVGDLGRAASAEAGERVSAAIEFLTDQISGAVKAADDMIRTSPWRAVGAVALAGLVVGILVARRSRRDSPSDYGEGDSPSEVGG